MKDEDIAKVAEGAQLLPMTAGEIVLAYNLPGNPKGLKLPREVYSNIFLARSPSGTIHRSPQPTRT